MAEETAVAEPQPQEAAPAPEQAAAAPSDPFALDEARLISLSPEQRAALDPVISDWKSRASQEIEKSKKTYEEKVRPFEEKATALDGLTKDPRFQQWFSSLQQQAMQGMNMNAQQQQQAAQVQPYQIATPEQWAQAVQNAYAGDPGMMNAIQQRMVQVMAQPVLQRQQELANKQQYLETSMEVKDIFEAHPDAKELDAIGLDSTGDGKSLLEMGFVLAEQERKPLEWGYNMAKKWANGIRTTTQREAMGLVQGKKDAVTAGPSTSQTGQQIVYVESPDELIRKNMEALMSGQKPPQFVIKPSGK